MRIDEVQKLVESNYGISGEVTQLQGERDLNFKIDTSDASYIFKVHASKDRQHLIAQESALTALVKIPGLNEPGTIASLNGKTLIDVDNDRIARLLTWTDGDLWSSLEPKNSELLFSLGKAVALIDQQLASVDFSSHQDALSQPFGWNVTQTETLIEKISLIANERDRHAVKQVFDHNLENVLPHFASLTRQIIHNDANDNNIIVSNNRVTSLIDFGDIIIAPRIAGLAVACAYILDGEDPVLRAVDVVRGYHQVQPLTPKELELLFPLIALRIATSITMAAIQSAAEPDNEYLLISQEKFTSLIHQLIDTSHDLSLYRFRNACGYEANPNSRKVREWLSSGHAPIAPVVFPEEKNVAKIWLDWSGENPDLPREWDQIKALMDDAGAKLAIGHYCENRDVYEGEAFSIDSPSRRTVHLGVDLFAPAGTPVYAGHDGTVELFNDNNVYLDYGPVIVLRHETGEGIPFFTLYGHLARTSLDGLYIGKEIKAGDQIATMGEEHENVGWPPHTHFQLITDLCGMGLDIYGVAPLGELAVWRSISPNPNLILHIVEGTDAHTHMRQVTIEQEREVVMSRALSLNFDQPLEIVEGKGAYLIDRDGRQYLDLVNNVAHVGHCNPRVVAAGQKQMATLNTNTRYINQNAIEYARALASTFPDPLSVVFFVNSGSEANDLALRLARAHTKARGMLVLDHAYHGHLSSIIDISPYKFNRKGGEGRPDYVRVVPLPDSYKGVHRGADAGAKYAAEFATQLADLNQPLCAFISESIVSTAGQVTLAEGFLKLAYEQTRAAGGVCIADEVQIGLARVGEKFWGFELHGVIPDIVTMGKPLGNGHPLAAVVTTPEIAHSFLNGMEYFNTFGGNPVSAAIGQAVLDVVYDQALQGHAFHMGEYLKAGMREMSRTVESIGDVRGHGLFLGVELVNDRSTQEPATQLTADLMEFAKQRGVFLSCDGPANNVLKIKPPMIIQRSDIDLYLDVVRDGLTSLR